MLKWLEVSGDFECNNRCLGCFSQSDGGPRMSTAEVLENLRLGRAAGARWLWIGGGEPTLRKDLFAIALSARKLGYSRVKLQTNGMMLAYPDYAARCVDAGVTEVNFAIKGATAEVHDRLTRTPGCFDLLCRAVAGWAARGLPGDGDVLVYRSTAAGLPEVVRGFCDRGVQRFNLWLLSVAEGADPAAHAEVPRIGEVMPHIARALALGLSTRPDFITSLHTPPCTVPVGASACLFHAEALDLLVANPGGYRFRLEQSPIEGGAYLPGCARCQLRARCGGPRADYLARFGEAEFVPITDGVPRLLPLLRDVEGDTWRPGPP